MGVDLMNPSFGRLDLGPTDPTGAMDHLALQVAVVNDVKIDDAEASHPSCRQIQQQGGTQTTGTDTQHRSSLQPLLALHPHLREDQVPCKSRNLIG